MLKLPGRTSTSRSAKRMRSKSVRAITEILRRTAHPSFLQPPRTSCRLKYIIAALIALLAAEPQRICAVGQSALALRVTTTTVELPISAARWVACWHQSGR
eukprot:CAMPEP_0195627914 /NCGR_PEP_ID=MMETSP0815-20121206/19176_1 /TAXON_ID=97485 /ORGANISM="Prymnesium parvum, Strain Texoma1" /LENGTH=100 /DNA_ID=CAMNT_0040769161 /DNA_START=977 /DNA_END=1276 /DNA_ORIENTATION=-